MFTTTAENYFPSIGANSVLTLRASSISFAVIKVNSTSWRTSPMGGLVITCQCVCLCLPSWMPELVQAWKLLDAAYLNNTNKGTTANRNNNIHAAIDSKKTDSKVIF